MGRHPFNQNDRKLMERLGSPFEVDHLVRLGRLEILVEWIALADYGLRFEIRLRISTGLRKCSQHILFRTWSLRVAVNANMGVSGNSSFSDFFES